MAFSVLNVKEKPIESWYNNITHGLFLLFKTKEQRLISCTIQFSVSWEDHIEEWVRIKFKQCGHISVQLANWDTTKAHRHKPDNVAPTEQSTMTICKSLL